MAGQAIKQKIAKPRKDQNYQSQPKNRSEKSYRFNFVGFNFAVLDSSNVKIVDKADCTYPQNGSYKMADFKNCRPVHCL